MKAKKGKWQTIINKGFTLIELLIVISLLSILTLSSISVFSSYSRSQTYDNAVTDVVTLLNKAKSRALSRVKPSNCTTNAITGYQVSFAVPGQTYRLRAMCGGTTYIIESKTLPTGVTFAAGSVTSTSFAVGTGIVSSVRTTTITGLGNTKTITVDTVGNISVF